jgi:mono/diheme cytochrome c family protein/glucose/arabinose dehydrogenase
MLCRLTFAVATLAAALVTPYPAKAAPALSPPQANERIALIGNGLGERMLRHGYFETLLHQRFPEQRLMIRNLCYPGDTPGYRPRSGRNNPWAFPGAAGLRPEWAMHLGSGHYPSPDEWLTTVQADTILAFFGFNESFEGPAGLERFARELTGFVEHTLKQRYNGQSAPRLVLVSPIAFEDLSAIRELPDGIVENRNLQLYTEAMRRVAAAHRVGFIDLFTPTRAWFAEGAEPLTVNGSHLNERGYRRLAPLLLNAVFGDEPNSPRQAAETLREIVNDKNWHWEQDYRMLNGVHAFGRRYNPFGPLNYPQETEKLRQMTALRDVRIWEAAARGVVSPPDDSQTRPLDPVETNYTRPIEFLSEDRAVASFTLPEGFRIELFAAESEFPALKNPVQMTFDSRGRLWVAVMPSYPHYRPGDEKPDDKILIFEDTDGDGRADRQTVFARGLHLPTGFELTAEGVYLSQQPNLVLLRDTDGDDQADSIEYLLSGFDTHDTHHAIGAFSTDPGGGIYLLEGRFLHSHVETPYGCVRGNDGGVYRFDPRSFRLELISQYDYNNPWGVTFDDWGQDFLSDASNGNTYWLLPLSLRLPFGVETPEVERLNEKKVRPTTGVEFISSRHFPEEFQGDFLVNNTIGFRGTKQYAQVETEFGFRHDLRADFLSSSDPNFRPIDLKFASDGSLYLIDWHNPLVGHMQHSARDPNRDHEHGRIYRITYPSRPLLVPPLLENQPIETLLEALKLPEYRSRYLARRELRSRPAAETARVVREWTDTLDPADPDHERHLIEALWITWSHGAVDPQLLERCLQASSHHARAAAARVIRYAYREIPHHGWLLERAANDVHPLPRLEALVAATWIGGTTGARVLVNFLNHPIGPELEPIVAYAVFTLRQPAMQLVAAGELNLWRQPTVQAWLERNLQLDARRGLIRDAVRPVEPLKQVAAAIPPGRPGSELWNLGREVYERPGFCTTCHQPNGEGFAPIFPSLINSSRVNGDPEALVKILLHGLASGGPAHVPPMPALGGMLANHEIAAVASYVRNAFGNEAEPVQTANVEAVRQATRERQTFYHPDELAPMAP